MNTVNFENAHKNLQLSWTRKWFVCISFCLLHYSANCARNNIVYLYLIILTSGFVKLIHVMFVEINFSLLSSSVTFYHYPACLDVQTTHASITLGKANYFCSGK
jgi:hypothetical protein